MKKVLVGSAVAVLAFSASAQEVKLPTVYGQVNKAILYTSQKKEMGYSKMSNLVDVKNSETRLGAKGTHEVNTLKINYNLLVGLDSSDPSTSGGAGSGRVRIRNAEVSFADAWGTIFAGQTGDIVSAIGAKMDPLATTVVGVIGTDQAAYVKNASSSIGYFERSRPDQIGYKTPEFMGLQYAVASSKIAIKGTVNTDGTLADETSDDNTLVNASTPETLKATHPGSRYYNLLSYNHKFSDMFKMEAYAAYDLTVSRYYKNYNDYMGALSFTYGEFTLNGQYSKLNRQIIAETFKKKNTVMQASVKWMRGDHTVALTWANRKNEEALKTAGTDANNGKYNQIAAGYMYNLNKYVQLRGVYAHYTVKTDKTTKTANWENTADIFSLGTLVTF